jgi:hypothetical protein
MTKRSLAVLLIPFFYCPVFGQSALPDSNANPLASAATQVFLQTLQTGKEIYVGPEHIEYLPSIEGIAYFVSKEWQLGQVQCDGILYSNELLLYDLSKDRLIVKRPDNFAIELRNDKLDWFAIAGHVFVNIKADNNVGLAPGIYDQLAFGALTVLARHRKIYEERVEETRVLRRFNTETTYFAVANNKAHLIRNMRSLLDLTGSKSSAIQQQLKKAGIKFKKDREAALTTAARFYNETQP